MEAVRCTVAAELPILLLNGAYKNLYMPARTRCEVIVRALKHQPKHSNFLRMVKEQLTQRFPFLLNEKEIIQYLIDNAVISNENIADCIQIANEHNMHEIEGLLKAMRA